MRRVRTCKLARRTGGGAEVQLRRWRRDARQGAKSAGTGVLGDRGELAWVGASRRPMTPLPSYHTESAQTQMVRILFVTGFHPRTRVCDLIYEFERFGPLAHCDWHAPRDSPDTRNDPYMYIEFRYERDAKDAYCDMDGRRFDGSRLSVDWARNPPSNYRRFDSTREASRGSPLPPLHRGRSHEPGGRRSRSRSRSPIVSDRARRDSRDRTIPDERMRSASPKHDSTEKQESNGEKMVVDHRDPDAHLPRTPSPSRSPDGEQRERLQPRNSTTRLAEHARSKWPKQDHLKKPKTNGTEERKTKSEEKEPEPECALCTSALWNE
ncbi:hypothetical protein EXIGLDRAFT_146365 [Exidia glandulosa HHB12029]|uniref:RRM domain-containing protein n=1 Tax=Exidia glandulosa HHB12029 TaxID=1314781 RepID=A0A165FSM3_EXIGL|nr:hypothetical protein EXIGLDRAFT_146365 [Exidia glandulosa HHB12029]